VALVAFIAEAEVHVLAVPAEPVAHSLGMVGISRHIGFLIRLKRFHSSGVKVAHFKLRLFREHIFGCEGRHEVGSVGGWGEAAVAGLKTVVVGSERSTFKSHTEAIATSGLGMEFTRDFEVLGKAFNVISSLNFLASEAGLAPLEVVVEAHAAYPAVLRELETLFGPFWLLTFSSFDSRSLLTGFAISSLLRLIRLESYKFISIRRLLSFHRCAFSFIP